MMINDLTLIANIHQNILVLNNVLFYKPSNPKENPPQTTGYPGFYTLATLSRALVECYTPKRQHPPVSYLVHHRLFRVGGPKLVH